jgi:hypothetical protein
VGGDQRQVDVAALPDRLAVVDRLQHGQLPRPLLDEAGDAEQVLGPLPARHRPPRRLVGPAGGGHGPVDVGGAGRHHLGQHLLGGGVHGLEGGALDGVDELAVDEQPVGGLDVDDRPGLGGGCVLEHRQSNVK